MAGSHLGKARVLLWQPQSGKKKGVRWYDFGGRKKVPEEFASTCALAARGESAGPTLSTKITQTEVHAASSPRRPTGCLGAWLASGLWVSLRSGSLLQDIFWVTDLTPSAFAEDGQRDLGGERKASQTKCRQTKEAKFITKPH